VRDHISRATPPGLTARVRVSSATPPVLIPRDDPALATAGTALARAFGREPVLVRSGGSIPAVALLQSHLGVPVVLAGFALASDGIHGPDEWFALDRLHRATDACIWLHHLFGRRGVSR
jgi:acetylornithine deacetylase/succinyl-diaminopimelate desuccinylase-like protein